MTRFETWGCPSAMLPPGPLNAITDVAGVRVGMTTLIVVTGRSSLAKVPSGPASR